MPRSRPKSSKSVSPCSQSASGSRLGLHRFLTVCTGTNPCRPQATYVNIGCDTGVSEDALLESAYAGGRCLKPAEQPC